MTPERGTTVTAATPARSGGPGRAPASWHRPSARRGRDAAVRWAAALGMARRRNAGAAGAGPRRRWSRATIIAAFVLAPVPAVAGCGAGVVEAPVPTPPASVVRLCTALHGRLPQRLHGRPRRATTPRSPLVTAWGSPAIVVRCGVPRPSGLRPTSELAVLDGVSWLALPPDRPVTFTAVGRRAYVEVTVPPKYNPPGDVLLELAAPIKAALPANPDASL